MAMHPDQLEVSVDVVRRLVRDQLDHWAGSPVRAFRSTGTVNAIFLVGDAHAARFPLRRQDPADALRSLESEHRAVHEFARCSPVPTPIPVAIGAPGHGYPLPWGLHTWLPGSTALDDPTSLSRPFAHDLAGLVLALRSADTRGRRFGGAGRGGTLRDHDPWVQTCLRNSEDLIDVPGLRRLWSTLRDLPSAGPDVMSHGDLMPGNVLVGGGRLVGVLDAGTFGPADPALDLVSAWHLLDTRPRDALRQDLGSSELEWGRGIAWALEQAIGLVWYYRESNPAMSAIGRRTLSRILSAA